MLRRKWSEKKAKNRQILGFVYTFGFGLFANIVYISGTKIKVCVCL